jgi:cell division protein FtsW (lipid II flippase)
MAVPIFIGVMILLVVVLIPWMPSWLVRPRNGARRWISLLVTDIQPSELAKVAYILVLASYLRFRANYRRLRGLIPPLVLGLIPMALVVVEPDLGTALLFLPTFFAVLLAAGARYRDLAIICLIGGGSAVAMYPLLNTYQKNRVEAVVHQLLGDDRHIQGIGYQGAKAISLIGAGGVTGIKGVDPATVIAANHLPEAHNDMVFAVIATSWGLAGIVFTWMLSLILLGGGLLVAGLSRDPFGRLVSVGIVAVLFSQMAVNTGMTIGLLPITGMTLPFVSAGGSSLVTTWMMIGLLVGVARRRPQRMGRASFEYDR